MNESDDTTDRGDPLSPTVRDPFESGVSRRRLIRSSAAVGATTATAGCTTEYAGLQRGQDDESGSETVFVFNTGDKTVSVIDPTTDEVVRTVHLGATSSFPANQYAPRLVGRTRQTLWLNVGDGVRAVDAETLETVAQVETGTGMNWLELSPGGEHLVVSAREPTNEQVRIDANPDSEQFGTVTGRIDRSDDGANGARPCDVTFTPDGAYAFVPDVGSDTLTVIDVDAFEIAAQVDVEPVVDGADARPWMATAAWNGELLAVEHNEGNHGTESIWDVREPTNPEQVARLTADDNLGALPLTNEIGPDSEIAYVFTPNSADVTVVDMVERVVTKRIDLGGKAFTGTWDPDRRKLYVPVQTADSVAVIDHETRSVMKTLSVGSKPYGATAGRLRPAADASGSAMAALAALGLTAGGETTYCLGNCHCGTHGSSH